MAFLYLVPIGIFSIAFCPRLPDLPGCFLLLFCALACLIFHRLRWAGWVLLGMLYGLLWGYHAVNGQLPGAYDGRDFEVEGYVSGLPKIQASELQSRTRFYFNVTGFARGSSSSRHPFFHSNAKILINWYQPDFELVPGQQLDLEVRLRTPRGTVNPAGFDYQAWLLRQGVSATGYVREVIGVIGGPRKTSVDYWRFRTSDAINRLPLEEKAKALLVALTVGDKQYLSQQDWRNYSRVGVVHLLVISGLHIGFAALAGFAFGGLLARVLALYYFRIVARRWGLVFGLLAALLYASMAGWSIPTQRACIMVAVVVIGKLFARNLSKGLIYGYSLLLVALLDPLAVLDGGFWLSFSAVALILWGMPVKVVQASAGTGWVRRLLMQCWYLFKFQLLLSLGLSVFLLLLDLPFSLISPLVNLIAIPWLSVAVVPLCLAGIVCFPLAPDMAGLFWQLAGYQLSLFDHIVGWLAAIASGTPALAIAGNGLVATSLLVAALFILAPLGWMFRIPGMAIVIALAAYQPQRPDLKLTILDVGQGLAVVGQTPNHTFVYDTGPRFSEDLTAGGAIVLPFIRNQGRRLIDSLIVSHSDSDHAGGMEDILEGIPTSLLIADPVMTPGPNVQRMACRHRRQWRWDGVQFTLINPFGLQQDLGLSHRESVLQSDNNHSCMLLIEREGASILLTGDIERPVERLLLRAFPTLRDVTVLLAPHHGSKTSSGMSFVRLTHPQYVVFSAGYHHHFGHPHPSVVSRYSKIGARTFNTATSGAVTFTWQSGKDLKVVQQRAKARKYWYIDES